MGSHGVIKKRILVVEDEPSLREICERVLTDEWFEVDSAENGKVAQAMIIRKRYDMCLIDIRMPEVNGTELYEWLQEQYPGLGKCVVFTTGDLMSGNTRDFLEKAARPFLPKPFTPGELESLIRRTLGSSK